MEQTRQPVVCGHCKLAMTEERQAGSKGVYFRCAGCGHGVSATYAELLQSDSRLRPTDPEAEAQRERQFQAVKERLERWLADLEEQDPCRVLGVRPGAPLEEIKARYHQAALENHPDRGGSAERMAELNRAFERLTGHHQRQGRMALPANGTRIPDWRPRAPAPPARTAGPRFAVPTSVLDRP